MAGDFRLRYARRVVSLPDHLKPVPVGRERLSRKVLAEHQRARVLEAAIDRFSEQGYPATTVDDLVAAAGIGVGSFYGHFNGKEECLLAVFDQICDEARGAVLEASAPASGWANRACLGLRALLAWLAAEPARGRIALVEIQTGGPAARARYEANLDEVANVLKAGRQLADKDGGLPASLEQTTVRGIAWLLHRRLFSDDAASLPALFDELAQLMLEPYLGPKAAKTAIAKSALPIRA